MSFISVVIFHFVTSNRSHEISILKLVHFQHILGEEFFGRPVRPFFMACMVIKMNMLREDIKRAFIQGHVRSWPDGFILKLEFFCGPPCRVY